MRIWSGCLPRRATKAEAVTPVAVEEIISCRERLGITQVWNSGGASGPVSAVRIGVPEAETEDAHAPVVMILPPEAQRCGDSAALAPTLPSASRRGIACVALAEAKEVPEGLRRLYASRQAPVFASAYDAWLLRSRLIGLLQEKGGRRIMVHGVLVRWAGRGVLILGESGTGKTACGLALVGRGGQWVADDAVVLRRRGDLLFGRGHCRTRDMIAVRGRGIVDARGLLGAGAVCREAQVAAAIRLVRDREGRATARGEKNGSSTDFLGIAIPARSLRVDPDREQLAPRVIRSVEALLRRPQASPSRTLGAGPGPDGSERR